MTIMNLNKKDVQNIADGRTYGGKGLGFIYRLFNAVALTSSITAAIYFLLINEFSPFETLRSIIPVSIQYAPLWFYHLLFWSFLISVIVNSVISIRLNSQSKVIVTNWEKMGKLPNNKVKPGVSGHENKKL